LRQRIGWGGINRDSQQTGYQEPLEHSYSQSSVSLAR
jgi:hypothetical protein